MPYNTRELSRCERKSFAVVSWMFSLFNIAAFFADERAEPISMPSRRRRKNIFARCSEVTQVTDVWPINATGPFSDGLLCSICTIRDSSDIQSSSAPLFRSHEDTFVSFEEILAK